MLTLREVTKQVRELNESYDGPGGVSIHRSPSGAVSVSGYEFHEGDDFEFGYEELPGDGAPFDAVAVARRLLAEYRWRAPNAR